MMLTDSPVYAVIMMLAGLTAGTVWYAFRLKKEKLPVRAAVLAAAAGSLLALACAKAGYLLHDLGANIRDGYYDEVLSLSAETLSFAAGCLGFAGGTALAARLSGIRPSKALDLFAAPGCVFLCLARLAEGGMDMTGVGSQVDAAWLDFFPLTIHNGWGDAYLSVFVLEALTALACLIPALQKKPVYTRDGTVFRRTAVCLLSAQVGWETVLMYPYLRSFLFSFVSLDQLICAAALLAAEIAGCVRNRRWWTIPATLCLMGLSALFQFFRDDKVAFMLESEWLSSNKETICPVVYILISAALIPIALKAVTPRAGKESGKM